MNEDIKTIQKTLMINLERINNESDDLRNEVARSNAVSQLANTYIKTCNLVIRVEESEHNLKQKIENVNNNEKEVHKK